MGVGWVSKVCVEGVYRMSEGVLRVTGWYMVGGVRIVLGGYLQDIWLTSGVCPDGCLHCVQRVHVMVSG